MAQDRVFLRWNEIPNGVRYVIFVWIGAVIGCAVMWAAFRDEGVSRAQQQYLNSLPCICQKEGK